MNTNPSNVVNITDKQPAPTDAKFTITVSIDGFPVTVEVEGKADSLRAMIDRLKAIGAEPPQSSTPAPEPAKKAAPVCPVHRTPMKASKKPGSWFCPRQTDVR